MTVTNDILDQGRLIISHPWVWKLHRNRLDAFESFYDDSLVGRPVRDVGPRSNLRVSIETGGPARTTLFIKRHEPEGFFAKLGSWLRFRGRRTPARVEWDNLRRLSELGIGTASAVALGEDPKTGRSFIATAEIEQASPADDFARERFASSDPAVVHERRDFARRLGKLVRRLHAARLTHRDLYLCHVFARSGAEGLDLRLIDLQRVAPARLKRWKVKDVAQLEFSVPSGTFTRTDRLRFLRAYFGGARLTRPERRFAAAARAKAESIRRRERTKDATP